MTKHALILFAVAALVICLFKAAPSGEDEIALDEDNIRDPDID